MLTQSITAKNTPLTGVGLIIKQNGKIILGRRHNEPMSGSWQLPGGWIHFGESPEQAVQRQLNGFQGLVVGESKFITYTNNVFDKYTHSLSLYFMLDCAGKEQQLLNTNDKFSDEDRADWYWADWNKLPQPLFLPLQLLKQSGFNPFLN